MVIFFVGFFFSLSANGCIDESTAPALAFVSSIWGGICVNALFCDGFFLFIFLNI